MTSKAGDITEHVRFLQKKLASYLRHGNSCGLFKEGGVECTCGLQKTRDALFEVIRKLLRVLEGEEMT